MELRQLEAFAAVMTVGSITGAGQMLGRSQPAITRQIKDLEESLGIALFERNGPKVTPSERAFSLLAEVEHALASLTEIRRQADHIASEGERQVRIVATLALAAGLVPGALAALPESLRPGQISLRSGTAEQALQWVLSKTVDVGVVSLPLEHRGVDVHWIGEAPCVAVVNADSPLASKAALTISDLAAQPVISLSNRFRLRRRIDRALAANGAEPRIFEVNSSLPAIQMARAGLGVAVVDPVTAHGFPVESVVVRPLQADIPFFFGVVSPYAHPLTETATGLIESLAETATAILPNFKRHAPNAHDALLQRIYASND